MIDIWLLFNLTIPFAEVHLISLIVIFVCLWERYLAHFQPYHPFWQRYIFHRSIFPPQKVLLQTYIEYLRGLVEEKKSINHHGREVEIDLDLLTERSIQVQPASIQAFDLE